MEEKRKAAREVIDILQEISTLLVFPRSSEPAEGNISIDLVLEHGAGPQHAFDMRVVD